MVEKTRAHILVSGQVQGVFFRENTRKKAEEIGISGWVRNLLDGRVEAVFEGEKEKVKEMIKWAKRGPDSAKVNDLRVKWNKPKGEFDGFEIKY